MRWVPDVIGVSGFGVAAHADNIAVAIMAPIEAIVFFILISSFALDYMK